MSDTPVHAVDGPSVSLTGPRIIVPRKGRPDVFVAVRRLLALPVLFLILINLAALGGVLTIFTGQTTVGKVLLVSKTAGVPTVVYAFNSSSRLYTRTSLIGVKTYNELSEELRLKRIRRFSTPELNVRYLPVAPLWTSVIQQSPLQDLVQYGPVWAIAVVFDIAFIAYIWPIAGRPRAQLALLREGDAVVGTVVSVAAAGPARTTVRYEFTPTSGGEVVTGAMTVGAESVADVAENDAVTVVYRPAKPSESVVYELCHFEEESEDIEKLIEMEESASQPPDDKAATTAPQA